MQFCRKFSFAAITLFLGGHFWPKFGGGGHINILMDQAAMVKDLAANILIDHFFILFFCFLPFVSAN